MHNMKIKISTQINNLFGLPIVVELDNSYTGSTLRRKLTVQETRTLINILQEAVKQCTPGLDRDWVL